MKKTKFLSAIIVCVLLIGCLYSEFVQDNHEPQTTETQQNLIQTKGFRNRELLDEHYDKHGKEMGFASAKDYEAAAISVVNSKDVLHKIEEEDGDDIYYLEATNEFVVVATDGYIRTYFYPSDGKDYFERQ